MAYDPSVLGRVSMRSGKGGSVAAFLSSVLSVVGSRSIRSRCAAANLSAGARTVPVADLTVEKESRRRGFGAPAGGSKVFCASRGQILPAATARS